MLEDNTEGQQLDNGTESQSQTESQTPPTNQQADARIDRVQAGLDEVRGMMGRLLQAQQNTQTPAPVETPPLGSKEFFEQPQLLLDRFKGMLEDTVKPLYEFKNEIQGDRKIGGIKASIKRDARMAKALEAVGDDTLDAALAAMKPEQITEQSVAGLLLTLYGNTVLNNGGMVPANPLPPQPSNSKATDMSTPAHLRSSTPPKNPAPVPQKTQLSAEEERVMQRFGYDINNEEHRKEFKAAADEGQDRGNRVRIIGKELL